MEQRWVQVLGAFEILGGLLCLAGSITIKSLQVTDFRISFPLLATAGSLFSATAGGMLLKRQPTGVRLSLLLQLAQVISFNGLYRYVYLVGPRVLWIIASGGTGIVVGGGGEFVLTTDVPDGTLNAPGVSGSVILGLMPTPLAQSSWALGLNLVAIYFAARLWDLWNDLKSPPASTSVATPEGSTGV